MKVLSLGSDPALFVPNSSVALRQIECGRLVDELHIISYTPANSSSGYPVTGLRLSGNVWAYPTNSVSKWRYFFDAYKIARDILKKGGRFIITSQEGMTNFLALYLSVRYKLGLEVQVHTDISSALFKRESLRNRVSLPGYRLAMRRARSIRVVSKRIAKFLMRKWGVPGSKITILPIYVDKDKWQNGDAKRDLHKEFPQFENIILMASRLTREKNIPLAMNVFNKVRERYPRTGLVVVGSGEYESVIKGVGVVHLPWSEDLASLYKSADIFLLTSDYEGFGLTLVESALCNLPIVTTDVGLVGDILTPYNALIAKPGDAAKLAEHICFLLQNRAATVMMRERLAKVADRLPEKEVYMKLFKASWQKCLSK
ncbi:MAG: glycosyltransferase family 4 protein [Patescibacteria group bacterium]|mgnify:CR=1 FL=1